MKLARTPPRTASINQTQHVDLTPCLDRQEQECYGKRRTYNQVLPLARPSQT